MQSTLLVLAFAFCFTVDASRSPEALVNFIATIVLGVVAVEVTACAVARPRIETELVSTPPVSLLPSPFTPSSFSPSSISTSSGTYPEVFLSFRGPDTRKEWTELLYQKLICLGINVFKDDVDIAPGKGVDAELLGSIKQSKISLPIISRNYASSQSCLMELVQMLECEKASNQWIVPIFYDISPTELKRQQGDIERFFHEHKKRGVNNTNIAKWKHALREIAGKKGYDLQNDKNGSPFATIDEVVEYILELLMKNCSHEPDDLVGIEQPVQEVMEKLGVVYVNKKATRVDDRDVRVLGLCGIPGVGKTTVAQVVFEKIRHLFQRCCSLSEITTTVKNRGVKELLEQLVSGLRQKKCRGLSTQDKCIEVIKRSFSKMKVLILLDDVQDFDEIKDLVGKTSWFGPGSRILMTIRRKDVLVNYKHEVADIYEVEPMSYCHAYELFCMHAFPEYPPKEDRTEYESLSKNIINNINGLPLSIKQTALLLGQSPLDIWQETLQFSRKKLEKKVKLAFEAIYKTLDEETRNIFLDVACFCCGMDQTILTYMWHVDDYYPSRGIKMLSDMCLIKIGENNIFWMHDQLKIYAKEIVKMEDFKRPRNRSRLHNHEDALSTLKGNESATNVEALCLKFDGGRSECFRSESFDHLLNVRILKLDLATIEGSAQNVFPKLRWLQWQGCRQTSELLIFHLENLVILDLSDSLVKGDSQEWGQVLEKAKNLKVLILRGCPHQRATRDFLTSKFPQILVI